MRHLRDKGFLSLPHAIENTFYGKLYPFKTEIWIKKDARPNLSRKVENNYEIKPK